MRGIGHGKSAPISFAEAIAIARAARPAVFEGELALPDGMQLGQRVVILTDESGNGTVAVALAASDLHEIAARRESDRGGELVVHFPREDYTVIAAG